MNLKYKNYMILSSSLKQNLSNFIMISIGKAQNVSVSLNQVESKSKKIASIKIDTLNDETSSLTETNRGINDNEQTPPRKSNDKIEFSTRPIRFSIGYYFDPSVWLRTRPSSWPDSSLLDREDFKSSSKAPKAAKSSPRKSISNNRRLCFLRREKNRD